MSHYFASFTARCIHSWRNLIPYRAHRDEAERDALIHKELYAHAMGSIFKEISPVLKYLTAQSPMTRSVAHASCTHWIAPRMAHARDGTCAGLSVTADWTGGDECSMSVSRVSVRFESHLP